jgi:hypothetical protein
VNTRKIVQNNCLQKEALLLLTQILLYCSEYFLQLEISFPFTQSTLTTFLLSTQLLSFFVNSFLNMASPVQVVIPFSICCRKKRILIMSASIVRFPEQVLYLTANYLLPAEEQGKLIFRFSFDWRSFMNTSKSMLVKWKRKSRLVVLNTFYSERFRECEQFREFIVRMVHSPLDQLELNFQAPSLSYLNTTAVVDMGSLAGVKKISVFAYNVSNFPSVLGELSLHHCNCDLAGCLTIPSSLRKFDYRHHSTSQTIDWHNLKTLEEASFSELKLLNYQSLSHLKSLRIWSDPLLCDISCFQNVRELDFSQCVGIVDVSSLGKVHKLCLFGCTRITDVSALMNVHTLDLGRCFGVSDVSCLTNVVELRLHQFRGSNLSGLLNVKRLWISFCDNITDISILKTLKLLSVSNCPHITRFNNLLNLREFHARGTGLSLTDEAFPYTAGAEIFAPVNTFFAEGFTFTDTDNSNSDPTFQWNKLLNVKTLKLEDCVFDALPSISSRLQSLTLDRCTFSGLPSELPCLGVLHLQGCPEISKISLIGASNFPVYSFNAYDCATLTEVHIARKVSTLEFKKCPSLSVVQLSRQVGHLKIVDCPKCRHVTSSAPIICQEILDHYEGDEVDY